jgi:hypothetical protein
LVQQSPSCKTLSTVHSIVDQNAGLTSLDVTVTMVGQVAAADTDALLDVKLAEGPPAAMLRLDARTIELQVHACILCWARSGPHTAALHRRQASDCAARPAGCGAQTRGSDIDRSGQERCDPFSTSWADLGLEDSGPCRSHPCLHGFSYVQVRARSGPGLCHRRIILQEELC